MNVAVNLFIFSGKKSSPGKGGVTGLTFLLEVDDVGHIGCLELGTYRLDDILSEVLYSRMLDVVLITEFAFHEHQFVFVEPARGTNQNLQLGTTSQVHYCADGVVWDSLSKNLNHHMIQLIEGDDAYLMEIPYGIA